LLRAFVLCARAQLLRCRADLLRRAGLLCAEVLPQALLRPVPSSLLPQELLRAELLCRRALVWLRAGLRCRTGLRC
jgi:hypothetical protein